MRSSSAREAALDLVVDLLHPSIFFTTFSASLFSVDASPVHQSDGAAVHFVLEVIEHAQVGQHHQLVPTSLTSAGKPASSGSVPPGMQEHTSYTERKQTFIDTSK